MMRKLYIPPINNEEDLMLVLDELAFRTHQHAASSENGGLVRKFHKLLLWFASQNSLDADQHAWFSLPAEEKKKDVKVFG